MSASFYKNNISMGGIDVQQNINYQRELDKLIGRLDGKKPTLLLHACCAPCSSYVVEYLVKHFEITLFFYNPNITFREEYDKRAAELKNLIEKMGLMQQVKVIEGNYEPESFFEIAKGLEHEPEGGERCFKCYELRLRAAAIAAREGGFDYFTTTLSISPLKNAGKLNEIGGKLSKVYDVPYLYSDFKKKNGYKRSVELSAIYGLYRQDYCGCVYSQQEREREKMQNKDN